jgi:hypothetical protein
VLRSIEGFTAATISSRARTRSILHLATKEESWSKSALNDDSSSISNKNKNKNNNLRDEDDDDARLESPLGVRRRVRAVLERARNRTGVVNTSVSSVIADAASIGGLGGVLQANGTVDVALDFQLPTPPAANGYKDLASRDSPMVKDVAQPKLVMRDATTTTATARRDPQVDAIKADVPAAFSEPLPFFLPTLSNEKKKLLAQGERIQEQSKMGREGSGYVVLDVKAPPYVVWECLLDFESYPQLIPTVRDVTMYTSDALTSGYHAEKPMVGTALRHYGTPSTTRAAFCLSKFRLNIAAIHNYRPHPDGDYMIFTLDPECTNMVLKAAKGIWHTQSNPDGRGEVGVCNCVPRCCALCCVVFSVSKPGAPSIPFTGIHESLALV